MPDTSIPPPSDRGGVQKLGRGRSLKRDDADVREIDRQRARVAAMSEMSRRVTRSLDLDTVLQEIVDGARSLADARYGAVGMFDDSGHVRKFITSGITSDEPWQSGNSPEESRLLRYLSEIREPLRLPDLARYSKSGGFPGIHPSMRPSLGAPVRYNDEPVGNIFLMEKEGGERVFTRRRRDPGHVRFTGCNRHRQRPAISGRTAGHG